MYAFWGVQDESRIEHTKNYKLYRTSTKEQRIFSSYLHPVLLRRVWAGTPGLEN